MVPSLDELFSQFKQEKSYNDKLSEETIRGYEASFQLFRSLMPTVTVDTITKSSVLSFFEKLDKRERVVGKGTIKTGVTRSTIATYRSKLNSFFRWLKENKYLEELPFKGMKYPKVEYADKAFLDGSNVCRIFSAVQHKIDWANNFVKKRNLAIFYILLCCGLRKSELLGLKMTDIDFDRKQIRIDGETSKSKRDRIMPLNSSAYLALKDYIEEREKKSPLTLYVFISDGGQERLTESGFKHLLEKVSKLSGVKFHAHQFRHTFAVNLINKDVDIAKLKMLLGHKDIRMTAAYVRCLPSDMLRADVELIGLDSLY